jgi:hypothetical protein
MLALLLKPEPVIVTTVPDIPLLAPNTIVGGTVTVNVAFLELVVSQVITTG